MADVELDQLTHSTFGQARGIITEYKLDWSDIVPNNEQDNGNNDPGEDSLLKYPFPSEVWGFRRLQELQILKCPHQKLPNQICNLVKLQRLTLKDCQFTELPANIGSLSCLEYLRIRRCDHLKSLPKEINYLSNLKSLVVESNADLESFQHFVPADIPEEGEGSRIEHRMSSLKSLDLSILPRLKMQHSFFDSMPSVEKLSVFCCDRVRSFPDSLTKLKQLKALSIYGCPRLRVLPAEIGQLVTLEELEIEDCPRLRQLPSSVQKLINVQNAKIAGHSNLDDLSPFLDNLTQVQDTLSIWYFNNLTSFPISITRFSRLEELELGSVGEESCSLPYLPQIKKLTIMSSHGGMVKNLFQDPGWKTTTDNANKPRLKELSLLHCRLLANDYTQLLRDLPKSTTVVSIMSPFPISFLGSVPVSLPRSIQHFHLRWDRSELAEVGVLDTSSAEEQNLVYAQQVMEADPNLAFYFEGSSIPYSPYLAFLVCFNPCGRALLGGNDNIVVDGTGNKSGCSDPSNRVTTATTSTSNSSSSSSSPTATLTKDLPLSRWPEVLAEVKYKVSLIKFRAGLTAGTAELEASVLYRLLQGPVFLSRSFEEDDSHSNSPDSSDDDQDEIVAPSAGRKRKATTALTQASISRKK